MNYIGFNQAVADGIQMDNWEPLKAWTLSESSFSYNYGSEAEEVFDEGVFQDILLLLKQQDFLDAKGSFHVLRIIEYDWSLLTTRQKAELLIPLQVGYSLFKSPMSWFIIAEILGEFYADVNSFRVLQELKKISKDGPRSLLPMAFYQIIQNCQDGSLSQEAYKELKSMSDDPTRDIKNEAEALLRRQRVL